MRNILINNINRINRTCERLIKRGWREVVLVKYDQCDPYSDPETYFDRVSDCIDVIVPWLKQRNIDFRILHGNFFLRRRDAVLLKIRWAGNL